MRILHGFLIVSLLFSCQKAIKGDMQIEEASAVPPSFLSIDVDLPVSEIAWVIDDKLPERFLTDKAIRLKKKSDTLFLSLRKYGKTQMAYRNGELFLSMPLEVSAVISKKVMGFTVSNDGNPLSFKTVAGLSSSITLKEDWDFLFECSWKGVTWQEEPVFNLMGFELNLKDYIEELISQNSQVIEEVICESVNQEIDFSKTVEKIYHDIQQPNRIAKRPFDLFISSTATDLKGSISEGKEDTLSMHVELRSSLQISVNKSKPNDNFGKLPPRSEPINPNNSFSVFPELFVTYSDLRDKLNFMLENEKFDYKGYWVNVKADSIYAADNKLNLVFRVAGDINGKLALRGRPVIDRKLNVSFEAFQYELLNVKEDWVAVTDMAMHKALEKYLEGMLQVDAFGFFDELDKKASSGLSRSRLGQKMDISLFFDKIQPYDSRVTEDGLQVILEVNGRGSIILNRNIIQ